MPVKVIIYMDYSLYFGVDYFSPPFWIFGPGCARTRPVGIYIVIVASCPAEAAIKIRLTPPNKLASAVSTSHYECNSNTMSVQVIMCVTVIQC